MTGYEVKRIREAMGMNSSQFAQFMGVHVSSTYRWESEGHHMVRVDAMRLQFLTCLQQELHRFKNEESRALFTQKVRGGLIVGGSLLALYKVLQSHFDDDE